MKKLKVIVIDDEMLIRKLIRMKMDTKRLNLEVAGEYANGAAALQELKEIRPDIVISDICMPEADGLLFSEECVKLFPEIKIILVTGYDDFEYARRGIKAGVFDYLLKPIQEEELNNALERATEQILKARGQKEKQSRFLYEIQKNKVALRDIYLNHILSQNQNIEEMKERLLEYGINIEEKSSREIQLGLIVVEEGFYEPEVIMQIMEEAKTFFQSDEGIIVLKDLWNRIVIISECEGIPFAECLDILNSLIKTKYKCRLFVGISGKFSGWREIHMAYLDALKFIQDKRMGENKKNTEDLRAWKQIENAVRRGNIEEAQRLGQMILDNEETDLVEVNLRLQTRFQKLCIDLEFSQNNLMFLKEIAWVYTKEQIKYCVGNIITELVIRRKINSGDNNSEVIEEILKYMIHHMGEEASLNFLAGKFSLSSSYLSKLIRNFTGKKYVELLSDVRLLKLLEMIHTTNMKDYDIGTMIGIQDPHYLSIWFKKMMGLSVTEYRKCISEKTK